MESGVSLADAVDRVLGASLHENSFLPSHLLPKDHRALVTERVLELGMFVSRYNVP